MKQKGKRFNIIIRILLCLMMITTLSPAVCFADVKPDKTVRVAYVIEPGYQEGGVGEYKTGYGYEYLQELARINGWKYEYIYGSFSELLEKLQKGEVDLMGNLSYSAERAGAIYYGKCEQGKENNYLYVNVEHNEIDSSDYTTINGKKIGVHIGTNQERLWENWCAEHGVECQIVEFDNWDACQKALNDNKIDAVVGGTVQQDEDTVYWQAAINFGFSPFYFGVSKQRPDLLEQLNQAQKQILDNDRFYNEKVFDKYVKPVSVITTTLDNDEKEWLQNNDYKVKVGYLLGFPPLCYQDTDGQFKGVAADVYASIEKTYANEGIKFEATPYSDYITMFSDLRKGKISVAWPSYDDDWTAEQYGYIPSDCVVSTPMMLIYEGDYSENTVKKIGVINTGSLPKIYAQINYPNSEIHEYDSYVSAINAIVSGEVSSVLYVSTTYNVDVENNEILQKLNMTILPNSCEIALAVAQKDVPLVSILNKGLVVFGTAGVNHSLITNSGVVKKVTVKDFFGQHPFIVIIVSVTVLVIIAGITLFVLHKNMTLHVKTSQAEKEVYERLSNSDPLTGLYNRKAVFNKCRKLLKEHPDEQFAMTHIDMVHFRLFNTFFGDEAGDKLLCDVADFFRHLDGEYDYWVYGRIEADVFCAFFPYDKKKYRRHISEILKYLKSYRADFLIEPKIGMYLVADPNMPIEAMFTRASLASREVCPTTPYVTVVYDEELERELNEKQQIINEMQMAIDKEQFSVYLQPKYSLRTNRMVGAEALVRWIHPAKGIISPGIFIPIFEGNGFITTLDKYMWEHVCQLLAKWKREGRTLVPISVNVSRLSMFGSTTVDFLKELVNRYDIEPKYLELELTESAYIDNPEEMKMQMHALREAGFTILLDDFGSGYSSLNTLKELPVDVLKLDMKFLSSEHSDVRGRLVISSIVRMSKLMNLVVIAEGVERQEQADYLSGIGCDYVQGFLFARPMSVEDYEKLLVNGSEPLVNINQPSVEHIGKIIAETGSGTYAMGTVIPVPLACLEYVDHQFLFLRVNPEFYTEFNFSEKTKSMSTLFREHLTEKSYLDLVSAFDHSLQNKKKVRVPILWNADDGSRRVYICSAAYEGNIGTFATIVVTFVNATDMVIMDNEKIETGTYSEIEDRLWYCVKHLLSANNISEATNSILREVLKYYDADRAYIFEFDWDNYSCSNTYEVCAAGAEPVIDTLQNVSIDEIDVWIKAFNERSLIRIDDLNDLIGDESRKDEYDCLSRQNIQSLVAVPVYFDEKLVGFLGVDNPRINTEDTTFIESLAFFCVNESLREKEISNLEEMSKRDPLTGAYNRKAWEIEQDKLVRKNIPFSVVIIDVDDYKNVNDRFGHQMGDELLKKIVAVLNKLFRAGDMVVRYGGDEFLVILENTGSRMENVLTKKLDMLNEILLHPDGEMPAITISAGIVFSDECNEEDLFRNADNALYHVKRSGKNGYHVYRG